MESEVQVPCRIRIDPNYLEYDGRINLNSSFYGCSVQDDWAHPLIDDLINIIAVLYNFTIS